MHWLHLHLVFRVAAAAAAAAARVVHPAAYRIWLPGMMQGKY